VRASTQKQARERLTLAVEKVDEAFSTDSSGLLENSPVLTGSLENILALGESNYTREILKEAADNYFSYFQNLVI